MLTDAQKQALADIMVETVERVLIAMPGADEADISEVSAAIGARLLYSEPRSVIVDALRDLPDNF